MGDSPDIQAARQVAEYIDTEHYEIIFTEEDVCSVLDDTIYHLETADITTIRASIGMAEILSPAPPPSPPPLPSSSIPP